MPGNPSEKICIIGGGIGALTTAYYLTDPSLAGRFDVTIYCMGWRLGGKGASGRALESNARIEEHGLHIWFGAYHNAIATMRRCYAELARSPAQPLASFDDAFKGQNRVVLTENIAGGIRLWPIDFPVLPDLGDDVPTVFDFLRRLLNWLRQQPDVAAILSGHQLSVAISQISLELTDLASLLSASAVRLESTGAHVLEELAAILHAIPADQPMGSTEASILSNGLGLVAQLLWSGLRLALPGDDFARRLWILAYLAITVMRGLIDDRLTDGGFDAVDGEEFRTWLHRHSSFDDSDGGLQDKLAFFSPCVQSFYDASFSYDRGDPNQPNVSAAVGLRCMLRIILDYRGSVVYEMQAGMGDVVFAPLYLALKKRGVRFAFFHRLTRLALDSTKTKVDRVEITRQIRLRGPTYEPLVDVKGLPCWPSVPDYSQILDGDALKTAGADLEHWFSGWVDTGGALTLQHGTDFDRLVLAISYDVLPFVADELSQALPPWRTMATGLRSVRTQAYQLWFMPTRVQLEMQGGPEIFGGYFQPWSSITDFSHLLAREDWPIGAAPGYLVYSCGTLPSTDTAGKDGVFQRLLNFVRTEGGPLWPAAFQGAAGFNFDLLKAASGSGDQRLRQQYWRANTDPTACYVLSLAGTSACRLRADQTGLANLLIAGEWTETGVNISSIETTVISGMRAARAISGFPQRIVGESDV